MYTLIGKEPQVFTQAGSTVIMKCLIHMHPKNMMGQIGLIYI